MEEAAAVRRAAREATRDVTPDELRETIDEYVDAGSFVPGVLTFVSARAVDGEEAPAPTERAAGVQLVYDGLRLTRELAQSDPWAGARVNRGGDRTTGVDEKTTADDATTAGESTTVDGAEAAILESDMAVLAADVLVSRGFYLLARTEAAEKAVEVARAFGRDQTVRETAGADRARALDHNLESDVLELALVAGVTAVGARPVDTAAYASALAAGCEDGFPASETFFDDRPTEHLAALSTDGGRALNRND